MRGVGLHGHSRDQRGQGTVEYGLLIAAGAVLVVAAMLFFAGNGEQLFRTTASAPVFKPPVAVCDPSYEGICTPPAPPDLDCDDLAGSGVALPIAVGGDDPHGFDPTGDALGC